MKVDREEHSFRSQHSPLGSLFSVGFLGLCIPKPSLPFTYFTYFVLFIFFFARSCWICCLLLGTNMDTIKENLIIFHLCLLTLIHILKNNLDLPHYLAVSHVFRNLLPHGFPPHSMLVNIFDVPSERWIKSFNADLIRFTSCLTLDDVLTSFACPTCYCFLLARGFYYSQIFSAVVPWDHVFIPLKFSVSIIPCIICLSYIFNFPPLMLILEVLPQFQVL